MHEGPRGTRPLHSVHLPAPHRTPRHRLARTEAARPGRNPDPRAYTWGCQQRRRTVKAPWPVLPPWMPRHHTHTHTHGRTLNSAAMHHRHALPTKHTALMLQHSMPTPVAPGGAIRHGGSDGTQSWSTIDSDRGERSSALHSLHDLNDPRPPPPSPPTWHMSHRFTSDTNLATRARTQHWPTRLVHAIEARLANACAPCSTRRSNGAPPPVTATSRPLSCSPASTSACLEPAGGTLQHPTPRPTRQGGGESGCSGRGRPRWRPPLRCASRRRV